MAAEPRHMQPDEPVRRRTRLRPVKPGRLPVTEATYGKAGAASPYGDDVVFPLPVDQLDYEHLHAEDE
jgi:hypothetical protein